MARPPADLRERDEEIAAEIRAALQPEGVQLLRIHEKAACMAARGIDPATIQRVLGLQPGTLARWMGWPPFRARVALERARRKQRNASC